MKTSTYKYILLLGGIGMFVACSTKKNTFINRNYHAVTTKYNVYYNGDLALQAGVKDLKTNINDNFWEILPVEAMQPTEEERGPTDKKNANFERAETKATKAIQKHSMYLDGSEKNPQMDESHLLLGKSRYFDHRYLPALEAFNYILYKYPNSDKIYEAKVWREKTNLRLQNEAIAIKNLKELIKANELHPEVYADANATLAQAYVVTKSNDSAVAPLRRAVENTDINELKARYRFILGQVYESLNKPDSAFASYQEVIDMKRKSPRLYVIQAHARQAGQFDLAKGDTLAFMEKYRDLLEDRENRPYLDVINHQVGLFYDKAGKDQEAIKYYNASLRKQGRDRYLVASNHRNIAEIYFKNAQYAAAGQYYDSTMTVMNSRTREFKAIKKKRDNLADVIKYESIASTNDSILKIMALSEPDRRTFFETYVETLKKQDAIAAEKAAEAARRSGGMASGVTGNDKPVAQGSQPLGRVDATGLSKGRGAQEASNMPVTAAPPVPTSTPTVNTGGSKFYFYNTSAIGFGKIEFRKRWGDRPLVDNWRWASELSRNSRSAEDDVAGDDAATDVSGKDEAKDARYMPEFYLSQLPKATAVDSLAKERNFAYYQLGIIYKEKFKEYQRAADKLEKLLQNKPEERLVLPAKYNLYKIYQIINPAKAEQYKQQVLTEYPDSRYAEIIRNPGSDAVNQGTPAAAYDALYKKVQAGQVREAYADTETYIERYTGEEILPKFELMRATLAGRLLGVEEYKKQLNYVALTYPDAQEGKQAEAILKTDIPSLEALTFGKPALSWKIVFKFDNPNDPKIKPLTDKINKFIKEGVDNSLTVSNDIYTLTGNLLVVHGFHSKLAAEDAASILKDYKTYKVTETLFVVSSEDYKVVQVKKNFAALPAIK